ncbi:hypothetical protein COU00_04235 [Candidatus Falkowbacteria bacterium CG10_big_fil_rev_8_21_14_0_10_43_11]|uniref:Uncharacterized protein n=1 Tax=Candidatus Falkowbacteria bacterium CG10_big_fil_rev_8_21_14_0_10_43_11 TaxID=1974568 RepID=A0A2M6WL31_9BACT|nr:MAG: hypothetical protein COU00_04235 [Candidatus Falkowbacteria bacterium CG10_big_fil_rev_8_21_14_0_10_43_11]
MSKQFPAPIKFSKLLGPSFIILALGLGSGEVILWPYLSANFGLGIAWGAVLGITCQYFINMEIERYALVKGESVFVGMNKLWRLAPLWFIASTFIGFGLPGIIAASAQVFSFVFGITDFKWVAIIFLILIGLILSIGKTVYAMMEHITKIIIILGIPFILVLTFIIARGVDWLALGQGIAGIGDGFLFWPSGMSLAVFLGAFAYAGAGGNLNLTQSIYIREKGYGMGYHSQKIAGLFRDIREHQTVKLTGEDFKIDATSTARFRAWWRKVSIEHLIVFWFLGALAMCLLMLLAYSTTFGNPTNAQGILFVINEGLAIGGLLAPWIGMLFLFIVSVMLFQTQLGIMDSTSRIMAENLALKKLGGNQNGKINLSKIYFGFIWAQIAFGVILFLFNIYEPQFLIILGAVINAFSMVVHIALTNWLNHKVLPKEFQARLWRKIIMLLIFFTFLFFCGLTVWDKII